MAIIFHQVSYEYSPNTPFSYPALKDIDLEFSLGKMTAIIGATGSGKTTLVQHLNALLLPTSGSLEVNGRKIVAKEKPKNLKELRHQVGLVFQFPEYQLFEETILKDVAFGPKNFGVNEEEANTLAKRALKEVGIEPDYYERSPLDLSGGQKRRVAIAGILAMNPEVLVLDEPTAGLDPEGTKTMMSLFNKFKTEQHKTILLVTHDMEQVMNYCDEVVVIKDGRVLIKSKTQDFFSDDQLLSKAEIEPPALIKLQQLLSEKGLKLPKRYLSNETFINELVSRYRK